MSKNVYLEKIAKLTDYAGAALGGTLGAGLSYSSKRDAVGKKYTISERILNGVSGGLGGAWIGHNLHTSLRAVRNYRNYEYYKDAYKNRKTGFKSKTSSIHGLHKDLEMPIGGFKTKAEAHRALELAGFKPTESVTKTTDYLVDEEDKGSTKRKKAESLGIQIITNLNTFLKENQND